MRQDNLKAIVESLLFVAEAPVTVPQLKKILPEAETQALRQALEELVADYHQREGGFYLSEVAGGFQFRTRPEYKEWVRRLIQPTPVRLSKAALETLAIIAYHQPVIRSDVEYIRGVDSGAVIRNLLERKLVRILGKKEIPGRPLLYGTTRRFLEVFNLKSLNDMPSIKEIADFGREALDAEAAEAEALPPSPATENEPTPDPAGEAPAAASDAPNDSESLENNPSAAPATPAAEPPAAEDAPVAEQANPIKSENDP